MISKHLWTKKISLVALSLALAVVVSACTPKTTPPATNNSTTTPAAVDTTPALDEVTVVLNTQNTSGESGTAVLKSEGGNTRVIISLDGVPKDVPQPAHIHLSSCATIGAVKYPLTSVINGASETVLPVPLANLVNKEQLSINVHKSGTELSNYVACGDLPYKNDNSMKDTKDTNATSTGSTGGQTTTTTDTSLAAKVVTINVTGTNFAYGPSEIKVKKGDKVKIVFTSTSGFHDWVVDEFNARTSRVNTGQTADPIEFIADKTGTFEYYCSVGSHRSLGMVGKLIVE